MAIGKSILLIELVELAKYRVPDVQKWWYIDLTYFILCSIGLDI